ncbi:hypothetical protein SESBI_40718 [Sesbania bispinosa]|nr:hypothetical protein SESBI_40718 [Sesbania bispinosa]
MGNDSIQACDPRDIVILLMAERIENYGGLPVVNGEGDLRRDIICWKLQN